MVSAPGNEHMRAEQTDAKPTQSQNSRVLVRISGVLAAATVTVIVSQSEAEPSETHTSRVTPTWASGRRPAEGARRP